MLRPDPRASQQMHESHRLQHSALHSHWLGTAMRPSELPVNRACLRDTEDSHPFAFGDIEDSQPFAFGVTLYISHLCVLYVNLYGHLTDLSENVSLMALWKDTNALGHAFLACNTCTARDLHMRLRDIPPGRSAVQDRDILGLFSL